MTTSNPCRALLALCLALAIFGARGDEIIVDPNYTGDQACRKCHSQIYHQYRHSGHPYKLQKLKGQAPEFPDNTSPGVPAPPADRTWQQLSYMIGGFAWKARFMDNEGYILTGADQRQYNLPNKSLGLEAHWTGYDAQTAPRKPYTCGSCHTTGWVETGPQGPHQDNLPGIYGVWASAGVTCEACHGPGRAHAETPRKVSLPVEERCDRCHKRGDPQRINAANGLIRHHEQYEDLLASPHRYLKCGACHDPHQSVKYGEGFKGLEQTCRSCHAEQVSPLSAAHPDGCIACHMPPAAKSAVSSLRRFSGGEVPVGDIRSHLFRISTDPEWEMFTEDGKWVAVDENRRAYLTVEYSCLGCHNNKDRSWALEAAESIHP